MITTHNEMLDEILAKITAPEQLAQYIKKTHFVRLYIEQVVNDKFIDFDAVDAEYNDFHRSLCGAFMLNRATANIFENVFINPKTTKNLKVKQFKSLSSMLFAEEAKILEAVLNKDLVTLYPTLTHEFICKALDIADDIKS